MRLSNRIGPVLAAWCAAVTLPLVASVVSSAGVNSWTASGPEGGVITALAFEPGGVQVVYAGTAGAGVFKSVDGGSTWSASSTGLAGASVEDVVVATTGAAIRVLAATTSSGLFESFDGGAAWSRVGVGTLGEYTRCIAVAPGNPNIIFVGAYDGLYRSSDGGSTWQRLDGSVAAGETQAVAVDPVTPSRVFAAVSGAGLFWSTDSGATWNGPASGLPAGWIPSIVVDPSSPTHVYAAAGSGGVFRSSDGGDTWDEASAGLPPETVQDLVLAQGSPQRLFAAMSSAGVARSDDGGDSWVVASTGLILGDVTALAVSPAAGTSVLAGTRGRGVARTSDAGGSWEETNEGLDAAEIYALAVDPTTPSRVYAGARHGGTFTSTDGGATWTPGGAELAARTVSALLADPSTPELVFAGAEDGVYRSSDAGATWQKVSSGSFYGAVTVLVADPFQSGTVYAATQSSGVYGSPDGGDTWAPATAGLPSSGGYFEEITGLAADPSTSGKLYAGTDHSGVFVTGDGGASWVPANTGLSSLRVRGLGIDRSTPTTLFVGTSGGLFKSTDGAGSWTGPVLDTGLSSFVSVVSLPGFVLASGKGSGVWRSHDTGGSWWGFSGGMATQFVSALAAASSTPTRLFAGTSGGVYVLDLDTTSLCTITLDARAPTIARVGEPVSFVVSASTENCVSSASYYWYFGDGGSSLLPAAHHSFATSGTFTWRLGVDVGSAHSSLLGQITVLEALPVATLFVPAVAHAPGAGGTSWRTDLALLNLTSDTAHITLSFSPYGGGTAVERTASVLAGQTTRWTDVLVALFGLPTGDPAKGTVRIAADTHVFATARTYNQTTSGTFGQYIPALSTAECLTTGERGVVPGLKNTTVFRSNIGFLNPGGQSVGVSLRLHGSDGGQLGTTLAATIGAGQYWQQDDVFAATGAGQQPLAYGVVDVTTPDGRVWAYGSVVDNLTGDPTTVPVLLATSPVAGFDTAALAHAPGAQGTAWRSTLTAANPGSSAADLVLAFHPYDGGAVLNREHTLAAGGAVEWVDVLVSLFGFPPGASQKGAVNVTASAPVVLAARTFNDTAGGTFGQYLPGVAPGADLNGGKVGVLPMLAKSSEFRSNVGVLNLGDTTVEVSISLFNSGGEDRGQPIALAVGAHSYRQLDDVFAAAGASPEDLAYATVHVVSEGGLVWAYASVVDNATGDPTTIPVLVSGRNAGPLDVSGLYQTTVGPAPAFTMELQQTGSRVEGRLLGKLIDLPVTGSIVGTTTALSGPFGTTGTFTVNLEQHSDRRSFSGSWEVTGGVPAQGTVTGSLDPWPTYDSDALGVPKLVQDHGIALDKIARVSRLRSGEGHDFSDDFEDCRSMKHYFDPASGVDRSTITIRAPFAGTVIGRTEEWESAVLWKGTALGIRSLERPEFSMTLFHVDLDVDLPLGTVVSAGQLLGTSEKASGTATDFAMWVHTPGGNKLVSYFEAMTDAAFEPFMVRGATSRQQFAITRAERDGDPLQCNGEQFADTGILENWVELE